MIYKLWNISDYVNLLKRNTFLLAHSMTSNVDIIFTSIYAISMHTMTSSVDIVFTSILAYTMILNKHIVCISIYAISIYYGLKYTYCLC